MSVPYHDVWQDANGRGPWPCFGCGQDVDGLGSMSDRPWREQGVVHHHDGNHTNDALSNLRVMHHGCHARHHNTHDTKPIHARMDRTSARHYYQQLADHIRGMVQSGELAPGDRLSGVQTIARDSDVSVGVAVRAIGILKTEGLLTGDGRGHGVFVRRGGAVSDLADDETVGVPDGLTYDELAHWISVELQEIQRQRVLLKRKEAALIKLSAGLAVLREDEAEGLVETSPRGTFLRKEGG